MKRITSILFALFISITGHTQDGLAIEGQSYKTAIGLRAGGTSGLTVKHFVGNRAAIEGIVGVWNRGLSATVLYERHINAFDVSGLNWYYGGGGHIAFRTGHYVGLYHENHPHYYRYNESMTLGVDGVIGLEYKVRNAPFAFSLDFKPFIEVNSEYGAWTGLDPGLGIKVTL